LSVTNYKSMLCNIPDESRSHHLYHGRSLESSMLLL